MTTVARILLPLAFIIGMAGFASPAQADVQCNCVHNDGSGGIETLTIADANACTNLPKPGTLYENQTCSVAAGGTPGTGAGTTNCQSGQFLDYGNGTPACVATCSGSQVGDYNDGLCHSGGCPPGNNCTTPPASPSSTPTTPGTNQGFTPLAPIPGLTLVNGQNVTSDSAGIGQFLNNLYKYLIGLATMLAVIMIVWGGLQYATQDSISGKGAGKEKILHALYGLVLILSPALIFGIINPQILNLNISMPALNTKWGSPTSSGPAAPPPAPPGSDAITRSGKTAYYPCATGSTPGTSGDSCVGALVACTAGGGSYTRGELNYAATGVIVCMNPDGSLTGRQDSSLVGFSAYQCLPQQTMEVTCTQPVPQSAGYTYLPCTSGNSPGTSSDNCQGAIDSCTLQGGDPKTGGYNDVICMNPNGSITVDSNGSATNARKDSGTNMFTSYACFPQQTLRVACKQKGQ